jgi:tellurite resistance protein TerC
LNEVLRLGRRIGIAIVGTAVVAAGVAMIVLPGPAIVVIPLGLGILSLEFERPRQWMKLFRKKAKELTDRVRKFRSKG